MFEAWILLLKACGIQTFSFLETLGFFLFLPISISIPVCVSVSLSVSLSLLFSLSPSHAHSRHTSDSVMFRNGQQTEVTFEEP